MLLVMMHLPIVDPRHHNQHMFSHFQHVFQVPNQPFKHVLIQIWIWIMKSVQIIRFLYEHIWAD